MYSATQIAISKARIIAALIHRGVDFLSQGQLTRIARWEYRVTSTDGKTVYSSTPIWRLHRQEQLHVTVVSNPDEFANKITLRGTGLKHSWAGEDTSTQAGDWILGEGRFGYDWHIRISDNGNECEPEVRKEIPSYDYTKPQAVLIHTSNFDTFNSSGSYPEDEWELIVYKPTGEEVGVTPLIEYIVKRFNLSAV